MKRSGTSATIALTETTAKRRSLNSGHHSTRMIFVTRHSPVRSHAAVISNFPIFCEGQGVDFRGGRTKEQRNSGRRLPDSWLLTSRNAPACAVRFSKLKWRVRKENLQPKRTWQTSNQPMLAFRTLPLKPGTTHYPNLHELTSSNID